MCLIIIKETSKYGLCASLITLVFSLRSFSVIKFIKSELYDNEGYLLKNSKILSSTIYYKDLFNKNYYDECELRENLIVLHDNEKIDE